MTHFEISENSLIMSSKPTLKRAAKYLVSAVTAIFTSRDPLHANQAFLTEKSLRKAQISVKQYLGFTCQKKCEKNG